MKLLKITAKQNGFRRAGREWSEAGEVIDVSEKGWTDARVGSVKSEPMLVVSEPTTEEKKQFSDDKKAAAEAGE